MHSYRAAEVDDWREFLGVTSRRHTKPFNIPVKIAAADHSVMKGFKADWVTPVDELYVIDKLWPNTTRRHRGSETDGIRSSDQLYFGTTRVFRHHPWGHGSDMADRCSINSCQGFKGLCSGRRWELTSAWPAHHHWCPPTRCESARPRAPPPSRTVLQTRSRAARGDAAAARHLRSLVGRSACGTIRIGAMTQNLEHVSWLLTPVGCMRGVVLRHTPAVAGTPSDGGARVEAPIEDPNTGLRSVVRRRRCPPGYRFRSEGHSRHLDAHDGPHQRLLRGLEISFPTSMPG